MIPGGQSRAQLVDAIVARLTAERDAIPHDDRGLDPYGRGARAGLAQAIDIVREVGEPDWHDEWCDANGCRCHKCPCSCGYAERAAESDG